MLSAYLPLPCTAPCAMTASRPDLSYWTLVDIGRADVLDRARRVLDGAPDGARCLNQFKVGRSLSLCLAARRAACMRTRTAAL